MASETTPTPAGVRIRRMGRADAPQLAPLFEQYRGFYGAQPDLLAARAFLEARLERAESAILAATAGDGPGSVIGFAQLFPSHSSLALRDIAILNDLFVAPPWRGLGIARRLLAAAIDHATERGAVRIELATRHDNVSALALYRVAGFCPDTEFARLTLALPTSPASASGGRR